MRIKIMVRVREWAFLVQENERYRSGIRESTFRTQNDYIPSRVGSHEILIP